MQLAVRYTATILAALSFYQTPSLAQSRRSLRCPSPIRTKDYRPAPPSYIEIAAGVHHSFMYRNDALAMDEHYNFSSRWSPIVGATAHITLSSVIGIMAGVQYAESAQGLKFGFDEKGTKVQDYIYSTSALIRLQLGITGYITPAISISAVPYLCFNSYYGISYSGKTSGTSATYSPTASQSDYDTGIYPGGSLIARFKITRRFQVSMQGAIDFGRSPTTRSSVAVYANGQAYTAYGEVQPRLAYAGAMVGYRLWQSRQ